MVARDAIAMFRRYEGMKVFIVTTGENYQLVGGITNADWVPFGAGGGGGGGDTEIIYDSMDVYGNVDITLRAMLSGVLLLDTVGASQYELTVSTEGELRLESSVGTAVTSIRLMDDDAVIRTLTLVDGHATTDVDDGVGEIIANCFLSTSPTPTVAYKLGVKTDGSLYLDSTVANSWNLNGQDNKEVFRIQQLAEGAWFRMKAYTTEEFPSGSSGGALVDVKTRAAFRVRSNRTSMFIQDNYTEEWNEVAYVKDIPAMPKDNFIVGSIQSSVLTLPEFLEEVGDPDGLRWKLLDGSGIPVGSALNQIKGWTGVPEGRGMALRGLSGVDDNIDPDWATRHNHQGSELGGYQEDEYVSHRHSIGASDNGTWYSFAAGTRGIGSNGTGGYVADNQVGTTYSGGLETRMKNIAVNYFIKYNR
jgi:hypothetical protein